MNKETLKDRIIGSMVGGAVGDALGYPIEFNSYKYICRTYGEEGVRRYLLNEKGVAEISDDTQMSMFTANGLLVGYTYWMLKNVPDPVLSYVAKAYMEWCDTQTGGIDYSLPHDCWIRDIAALNSRRAPGNTCMSALLSMKKGEEVCNNSKGCGGVMRVAPIGLLAAASDGKITIDEAVKWGCEAARFTHKHPLGFLPAGLLVNLVGELALCEEVTKEYFDLSIVRGFENLRFFYEDYAEHIDVLENLVQRACELADGGMADVDAIREIGEGWVGEEALAIAIYCVRRHFCDFEEAIVASVNHSGDSDSTGAVAGNLIGAMVGYKAIPEYYKKNLELLDTIKELAEDLSEGCCPIECDDVCLEEKFRWENKYASCMAGETAPIKNSYLASKELNLFVGEYPGAKDRREAIEKLKRFAEFTDFIDLTEVGELVEYESLLPEGVRYYRFPIVDCGVPESVGDVVNLCERVVALSRANGKTYMHCWGGVGRAGMMMICVLAYVMRDEGFRGEELYNRALERYQEIYKRFPKSKRRSSPENAEQIKFVRGFVEEIS